MTNTIEFKIQVDNINPKKQKKLFEFVKKHGLTVDVETGNAMRCTPILMAKPIYSFYTKDALARFDYRLIKELIKFFN